MFPKLVLFSGVFHIATFVAAITIPSPGLTPAMRLLGGSTTTAAATTTAQTPTSGSCNTGTQLCCDAIYDTSSEEANFLLKLFDIPADPINTLIGASCSPITVAAVASGSSCASSTICCNNTSLSGGIAAGCILINQAT